MKQKSYRLEDLKNVKICIGYVGENKHTQVRIDCSSAFAEYPGATPALAIRPPRGGIYPAVIDQDGDTVVWTVTNGDLLFKGDGELQFSFIQGEVIEKTFIGKFEVLRSIITTANAPDGVAEWLIRAVAAAAAAEAAARHQPMIGLDGYWYKWDSEAQEYVNTGTKAQGPQGEPGAPGDPSELIDDTNPAANKVFSSSKVDTELGGVKSALTAVQDDVSKASYVDSAVAGTKNAGFFINSSGKLMAGGSQYCVTTFPVTQGKKYRIVGDDVKLYGNYGLVCFATTSTAEADKQLTLIQMGSSTATDYDFYYIPQEDGYLFCAWIDAEGYAQLSVFSHEPVSGVIEQSLNANIAEFGTKTAGCFILNNGKIIVGGSTSLCISTYPVTQGIKYRVVGNGVKLMGAYGLVGFATTSTVENDKQTVLIKMGSSTATDYDFYYIPPENGYLFCAWIDETGYSQLSVCSLEPVADAIDDLLRYTQWSNVPIKMQVFGDSISDDTSRTTWATLISTYLAQRTINLTNSAVGGSSYGHGHVDGKYGDHVDGNMVNDLLKDGTLQTDADIIVMFAGTNNWAGETPLGQWGDDTVSTFYGAVRDAFDYLSTHTNALVIVCTPSGRYNATDASRSKNSDGLVLNPQGKTLRQFCDAIVETAHLYQYPVVDLYYDLGWNINNVSHFTEDGLHPNLIGAKFLSQFIIGRMKTHLGI